MIQYSCTMKNNIYHSNKWGPPPFLHLDFNPVIVHTLVHSVDKIHVLDVTVDLIWLLFLNILSFNLVATPRKSLRFTRFIRSYLNRPAVALTNQCQCVKLHCFFVWYALFKVAMFHFFCRYLFPMMSTLLNTLVARMLWTSTWVTRRTDVK